MQRMVAFARDMTSQLPFRPGLIWFSGAASSASCDCWTSKWWANSFCLRHHGLSNYEWALPRRLPCEFFGNRNEERRETIQRNNQNKKGESLWTRPNFVET